MLRSAALSAHAAYVAAGAPTASHASPAVATVPAGGLPVTQQANGRVSLHFPPQARAAVVVASTMSQLRNVPGYTFSDSSFATTDPLLAACSIAIIPVAQMARSLTLSSASLEVVVDVNVYGAGLGGRVLARTLRQTEACAGVYVQSTSPNGLDGFVASSNDVQGSSILEVTARVGDVVFSLYGFPTAYQSAWSSTMALALIVLSALTPAMATVCAAEHAGAADAQRNPTQSDYHPYAVATIATPPTSVPRPNLELLNGALPVVATPTPGSITSAPTPPVVPTVALSATYSTLQNDQIGPGCGWAFTAMVPPTFSPSTDAPGAKRAAVIAQLETTWTNWPVTVKAYLTAKAVYLADLASYQATIPSTTTTTTTTTVPPTGTTTTTSPVTGNPSTTTTPSLTVRALQ